KNCKASNIGKPSVYTSAPVSTPATPISPSKAEQAEEAVAPVNPTDVGAAKRALDTAKKNLEEGKKVRYGNERNYARYLDRINGLEKAVRSAQENYDAAQRQPASQDPVAY
ncbi:lipoic acid synthetase, partial [Neisseria sp. P0001.S004]